MRNKLSLSRKPEEQFHDAARDSVLEKIVRFVREESTEAVLNIALYASDAEARANGWDSAAAHRHVLMEIMQTLPVDVRWRVKIDKGT